MLGNLGGLGHLFCPQVGVPRAVPEWTSHEPGSLKLRVEPGAELPSEVGRVCDTGLQLVILRLTFEVEQSPGTSPVFITQAKGLFHLYRVLSPVSDARADVEA